MFASGSELLPLNPKESPTMNTITRDELKSALADGAPMTLLEALPEKYYRHGHLPGARLVGL